MVASIEKRSESVFLIKSELDAVIIVIRVFIVIYTVSSKEYSPLGTYKSPHEYLNTLSHVKTSHWHYVKIRKTVHFVEMISLFHQNPIVLLN